MSERAVDVAEFRRACGLFLTGVTVVTARAEDGTPLGITANSFTSVSLEPPLVLICLDRKLASYAGFQAASHYAVHLLGEDQAPLSTLFARRGAPKFARFGAPPDGDGDGAARVPRLPECLARFVCRTVSRHDEGDHGILVGRVEGVEIAGGAAPLGFFAGRYTSVNLPSTSTPVPDAQWALGWA